MSHFAIILLIVAGVATRAVAKASDLELGADIERLTNVTLRFAGQEDPARRVFLDAAMERLRNLHGVHAVTRVRFPLFGNAGATANLVSGRSVQRNTVDEAFFETAGIRIVRGRVFSAEDVRSSARVAVISEQIARTYWGTGSSAASPSSGPNGIDSGWELRRRVWARPIQTVPRTRHS